ncbi:N-acetyl-gamma-glutamyl-phosphate reductase [Clostridia bacterium]|nr:N-acetyl-gamma-glutamyl-phosphate reductase [Clostridia bacterium]
MTYRVFIDGQAGTTGLRIAERLGTRDDIELIEIDDVRRKEIGSRLVCIAESDVTILCLPDEGAKEIAIAVRLAAEKAGSGSEIARARLIDASTAHRVKKDWVYGMPELMRDAGSAIQNAKYVANPGCHATGFILSVRPLAEAGIVKPDAQLSAYSLTGFSGGGKSMIAAYEAALNVAKAANTSALSLPDPLAAPRLYGLTQAHKHLPEMQQYAGVRNEPFFSPIVSGYYAGMLVGVSLPKEALAKSVTLADVREALAAFYDGRPLIHVRRLGAEAEAGNGAGFLAANAFANRDDLEIFVTGNDDKIVLVSRYDNLGKGASGAAIQNMNLMLGLPEETGLALGD